AGDRVSSQHSMGQYAVADGGDLDPGHGDRLARRTSAHQRDIPRVVPAVFAGSKRCGRDAMAGDSGADYWPDVSAVYFFHVHRSEDDGEIEVGTVCRGIPGGAR